MTPRECNQQKSDWKLHRTNSKGSPTDKLREKGWGGKKEKNL